MSIFGSIGSALSSIGSGASSALPFLDAASPYVSAGLSYIGAGQQNEQNMEIAQKQMDFQAEQARINRRFQRRGVRRQLRFERRMSNTAYGRAMRDMKRSGLNPILAYGQGGASVPSINAPAGSAPGGASIPAVNELEGAANSALTSRLHRAQLKQAKATLDQTRQGTKVGSESEINVRLDNELKRTQEWKTYQEGIRAANEAKASFHGLSSAKSRAGLDALTLERVSDFGASATGQNLFSLERMLERALQEMGVAP